MVIQTTEYQGVQIIQFIFKQFSNLLIIFQIFTKDVLIHNPENALTTETPMGHHHYSLLKDNQKSLNNYTLNK